MKPKAKVQLIAELKAVQARVAGLERQVAQSKHAAEAARALVQLSRELARTLDLAQASIQERLNDARDEMLHHGRECIVTFDCPSTITNETIMRSLRDESHLILLYRIVLEAIINARKHSKGTSIGVRIRSPKPGVVEISIHDDGIGDGGPFAEHVGLALMSQRAEEIGAELEYTPAYPGGGTVVRIRLKHRDATEAPTAAQVIAAIKSHSQPTPKLGADHATGSER